jgi:hypothetical protein
MSLLKVKNLSRKYLDYLLEKEIGNFHILCVVFHRREIWSVTLSMVHRLREGNNRVLRKRFGHRNVK